MAWIDTRAGEEPEPRLRELYERVRDPVSGELDHIMEVHALHPRGLAAHFELYTAVMRPSPTLGKAEREMVALVVSTINECHY